MTTKLLAVDDSKTMRRVLEITFSGEEFQTTILGSAEEALAAVKANPPHVALLDGHLGSSSSGYDLCRAIKQAAPATRVIILASKQRPYDEGAGTSAGADGTFDKPFDSTKMVARIAEEAAHAGPTTAAVAPPPAAPARVEPPRPVAPPPMAAPPEPAMRPASAPANLGSVAARRPPAPAATTSAAPPRVSTAQAAPVAVPAPVAAAPASPLAAAAAAGLAGKLEGLGLTRDQVAAVLSLSREVVEQAVWEVVPVLAETLIKEEIARLTAE